MNNCRNDLLVMSESGWVWFITVLILQEVKELEEQKERTKDDDQRRELERRLEQKLLENDLADAKWVRQRTTFEVTCY